MSLRNNTNSRKYDMHRFPVPSIKKLEHPPIVRIAKHPEHNNARRFSLGQKGLKIRWPRTAVNSESISAGGDTERSGTAATNRISLSRSPLVAATPTVATASRYKSAHSELKAVGAYVKKRPWCVKYRFGRQYVNLPVAPTHKMSFRGMSGIITQRESRQQPQANPLTRCSLP